MNSKPVNKKFETENNKLAQVRKEIAKVVVGQDHLIERLLISMLCSGHVLIEGIPGLAKTLTISTLAKAMNIDFSRIQFTPDLLPGDLTGTLIYNQNSGEFTPHKGPLFANLVLADEINRSPAKVQSALLEAMQERQVTIGKESYKLDDPFLVMATQNPIEQEGTYPLPEAQLDRFMFKVCVSYPSMEEEHEVMKRMSSSAPKLSVDSVMDASEIVEMRQKLDDVFSSEEIEKYILRLVDATRSPQKYNLKELEGYISHGASPRASIFLLKGAKAHAFINGRDFITPQDVKSIAMDTMRHRVSITYKAEAENKDIVFILQRIFDTIEVSEK
jgi:MoxR-like ATPase